MSEFSSTLTEAMMVEFAIMHIGEFMEDRHYDVISSGKLKWEDFLEGDGVAITIKVRSRATTYEVWEYFWPKTDDADRRGEVCFCRVASTGDNDNDDWRTFMPAEPYRFDPAS